MQLGIKDAFSENADFNGISIKQKLNVSAIRHVAAVEVTTEGTFGAATSREHCF